MDGHDGPSTAGDLRCHLFWFHVPGKRVAVDQNGGGAGPDHSRNARNDGKGGKNHLVARSDAQCNYRSLQGGSAVANGDTKSSANLGGKQFLKFADERAFRGDPASLDTLVE